MIVGVTICVVSHARYLVYCYLEGIQYVGRFSSDCVGYEMLSRTIPFMDVASDSWTLASRESKNKVRGSVTMLGSIKIMLKHNS